MKNIFSYLLFLVLSVQVLAQDYSFEVEMKNFRQIDETSFQWDIFIRKGPNSPDFALYTMQTLLQFNTDLLNGGAFENEYLTIDPSGNDLFQTSSWYNNAHVSIVQGGTQINWATIAAPNPGENVTVIGGTWRKVATFRAQLRKGVLPHNFADVDPVFAFELTGDNLIVRRCEGYSGTNPSATMVGGGNAEVGRSNSYPNLGVSVNTRQLAGYWFSGDGDWEDIQNWNNVTAENANIIPGPNANVVINGNAIIPGHVSLLPDVDGNGGELTVLTGTVSASSPSEATYNIVMSSSDLLVTANWSNVEAEEEPPPKTGNPNMDFVLNEKVNSGIKIDSKGVFNLVVNKNVSGDPNGVLIRAYNFGGGGGTVGWINGSDWKLEPIEAAVYSGDQIRVYTQLSQDYAGDFINWSFSTEGFLSQLTIGYSGILTVDKLFNDSENGAAAIVIQSDATGTGSLIHNNAGVEATVERYFETGESWRLVSSPVAGQEISGEWTPPGSYQGGTGYDFYGWDEPTQTWKNRKADGFSVWNNGLNFNPAQGYLISFEEDVQTKTFAGSLNNGDVSIGIGFAATGPYAGSNLIGNPYPSGIDWSIATRDLFVDNFAYIYDRVSSVEGTTEGYLPLDGELENAFIAANQGFFVLKENPEEGIFSFSNDMRVHAGTFTKNTSVGEFMVLRLSNNGFFDEATIRLIPGSEFDRDRSDALKLYSYNLSMPQLYSLTANNVRVAINSVPEIAPETEFTLGMLAPATGHYTLSLNEVSGLFQTGEVYLKDLLSGHIQNLKQQPEYAFAAEQGDNPARFVVTFAQPTNVPAIDDGSVRIFAWNKTLFVSFPEEEAKRILQVFDLSGRMVLDFKLDHGLQHTLPLNVEQGVYIVRVMSPTGTSTQRVFVR